MYEKLRVAIAQAEAIQGNVIKNEEKIVAWVKDASDKGANMICFPELFYSAYDVDKDQLKKCAVKRDDAFFERMKRLAADFNINILISYPEKTDDKEKPYIAYAFISSAGEMVGNHRKSYLWGEEPERVEKADPVYDVISTPFGKIGTLICYEVEFPEPARILTLNGAEIIIVTVAMDTIPNFHRYISSVGILNHVYAIGINGVRTDVKSRRGGSCVADQKGKIVYDMSVGQEELGLFDIDLNIDNRRNAEPHMTDMNIETLKQLAVIEKWK